MDSPNKLNPKIAKTHQVNGLSPKKALMTCFLNLKDLDRLGCARLR